MTFPEAYSLSVSREEMYICQFGNFALIASSHALIPASPVLISWPPPTRQTIAAQSLCRSMHEIRNSGSDCENPGRFFFLCMKFAVCLRFQARCASSKMTTCSNGGSDLMRASSRKWWTFWMKALTLAPTVALRTFSPWLFLRDTPSRVSASRRTETSGPLPDRKTAWVGSFSSRRRVARFSPTSVFPAPGTPVTKQMILCLFWNASSTNASIRRDVVCKFLAPASNRAISSTECCEYSARAASIIVGVG